MLTESQTLSTLSKKNIQIQRIINTQIDIYRNKYTGMHHLCQFDKLLYKFIDCVLIIQCALAEIKLTMQTLKNIVSCLF